MSQANLSDWDFLKARARSIGYHVDVDDGKLNFKRPPDSATAPDEGDLMQTVEYKLVFGQDLIEYRPRLSSAGQVDQVEVRGWDRQNKQELVGQAAAATTSAQIQNQTPASVAQPFGSHTYVQAGHPGSTSDEIDAAASSVAEHIAGGFAEAEGLTRGNGILRAGVCVNISGVAPEFNGRFVLSHTHHRWNRSGYWTHFQISGQQHRTLLGLVSHGSQAVPAKSTGRVGSNYVYGVVTALVTANNDPDKLGRVKLKMPWLSAAYETNWAPVVQAGAGPDSGAVFLPEVDDEVLVAFDHGDFNHPYVIGGLHNGKDKPKLGDGLFDNGKVKRRGFVSRKGHRFVFFDADGDSGIALLSSDNKVRVALKETGGEIHIYGDSKVVIESAQAIELKSNGTLSLQSSGKLSIKSDGVVDIDGSIIQLN